MEEKPKSRTSRQKDEAPAFTSSVFALLDVYLTKMLVRPQVNLCNILDKHFDCGLPIEAQDLSCITAALSWTAPEHCHKLFNIHASRGGTNNSSPEQLGMVMYDDTLVSAH